MIIKLDKLGIFWQKELSDERNLMRNLTNFLILTYS